LLPIMQTNKRPCIYNAPANPPKCDLKARIEELEKLNGELKEDLKRVEASKEMYFEMFSTQFKARTETEKTLEKEREIKTYLYDTLKAVSESIKTQSEWSTAEAQLIRKKYEKLEREFQHNLSNVEETIDTVDSMQSSI